MVAATPSGPMPGELAGVTADLVGVGDHHAGELEVAVRGDARIAGRPTLPVPHTTTLCCCSVMRRNLLRRCVAVAHAPGLPVPADDGSGSRQAALLEQVTADALHRGRLTGGPHRVSAVTGASRTAATRVSPGHAPAGNNCQSTGVTAASEGSRPRSSASSTTTCTVAVDGSS